MTAGLLSPSPVVELHSTARQVPRAAQLCVAATRLLEPIALQAATREAELLERVDRKYFLPIPALGELTQRLARDFAVLDIDGRQVFGYQSVDFDTPSLASYRAHVQGRRRRFKVRTRTYLDSGLCMLEVKLKGFRGMTVKLRTGHQAERTDLLDARALEFVAASIRENYDLPLPDALRPMLVTTTHRATLINRCTPSRITLDVDLRCSADGSEVAAKDTHVLVETKGGTQGSLADHSLHDMGIRPVNVSKYCVGVAMLHPHVASNPWHRTLRRYFEPPVFTT
jgi:hypothetical protein